MLFIISDAKAEVGAPLGDAQAAETSTPVPPELSAEKMLMDNLMILGLLFFIFYFMLIRPQQRKVKAHQTMIKGLAKGQKIITAGGIIGTIAKFEGDDIVVVEIAPETKIRLARSSVSDVMDSTSKTANDN